DALAEPEGVVALERLAERRPRDQDVVAAGRHALQPFAPPLAQPPLHAVPLDGRAVPLRHGDAEPRIAVVVPGEPVEDEEARRDRPAVPVDGVEIAGAGESVTALHERGPLRRRDASGPWRGGASGSSGLHAWTCGLGSRASASGDAHWAGR